MRDSVIFVLQRVRNVRLSENVANVLNERSL